MSIDATALATSPEPSRPATPSREASDLGRQAWQREMERAQTESWFKQQAAARQSGPLPKAMPAYRPGAAPVDRPAACGVTPPHPVFAWAPARAAAHVVVHPAASASATPPTAAQAGANGTMANADAELPVPVVAPAAASVPPNGCPAMDRLAACATEPGGAPAVLLDIDGVAAPVRVHVQWDEGVVRVWVGVDAAHAEHLPRVASMVTRWLAGQGVRVMNLTCNGEAWPVDTSFFDSKRPDADAVIHITEITRTF